MMGNYQYFFAKVGSGNIFLNTKPNSGFGKFWIGYSDISIAAAKTKMTSSNLNDYGADFFRLLEIITNTKNIAKARIVTYSKDDLLIWSICKNTATKKYLEEYTGSDLVEGTRAVDVQNLIDRVCASKSDKVTASLTVDICGFDSGIKGDPKHLPRNNFIKFLNVKLENSLSRKGLPACINSLSVNSYLNRGTFRYLYSTNYEMEGLFLFIKKNLNPLSGSDILCSMGSQKRREYCYGAAVRHYLDWRSDAAFSGSFCDFLKISQIQGNKLTSAMMSPSQLESAAVMLVMDMGFTAEVAIANSMPDIDVRGSVRHKKSNVTNVVNYLKILHKHGILSGDAKATGDLYKEISSTFTLDLQCKNYGNGKVETPENVVLFRPHKPTSGGKQLTVDVETLFTQCNSGVVTSNIFLDWIELAACHFNKSKKELKI